MKQKKNDILEYKNKRIKRRLYKGKWYYSVKDIINIIENTKDINIEKITIDNEDFMTKENILIMLENTNDKEFKIWFNKSKNNKKYIERTPLEKYHKKIENLKKGLKKKTKGSNNYKKEKTKINKTYKKINNYKKHNKRNGGK